MSDNVTYLSNLPSTIKTAIIKSRPWRSRRVRRRGTRGKAVLWRLHSQAAGPPSAANPPTMPRSISWRGRSNMEYRSVSGSDATRRIFMSPTFLSVIVARITAKQVRPMLKRANFPIAKIFVPAKRRTTLRPEAVREIAESMLEIGQETPILVRRDGDRFALVEGLHRLEACKALGEETIVGFLVSRQSNKPRHLTMARQTPFARRWNA